MPTLARVGFGFGRGPSGPPAVTKRATHYAALTDSIQRNTDFVGNADGKKGIVSGFFKAAAGQAGRLVALLSSDDQWFQAYVGIAADNAWQVTVIGFDALGNIVLTIQSLVQATLVTDWHGILASWDLGAGVGQLVVDRVDVTDPGSLVLTDANITYTSPEVSKGWILGDQFAGHTPYGAGAACCYRSLFFDNAHYLDASPANVNKFFTAAAAPVLTAPGDVLRPTGVAPLYFSPWCDGNNFGSGGRLDVITGAPSRCTEVLP